MKLREASKTFLEMPEHEQARNFVCRPGRRFRPYPEDSEQSGAITLDADDIDADDWKITEGEDY